MNEINKRRDSLNERRGWINERIRQQLAVDSQESLSSHFQISKLTNFQIIILSSGSCLKTSSIIFLNFDK